MRGGSALSKLQDETTGYTVDVFHTLVIQSSIERCKEENKTCPGLVVSTQATGKPGKPYKNVDSIKVRCSNWESGCEVRNLVFLVFLFFFFVSLLYVVG